MITTEQLLHFIEIVQETVKQDPEWITEDTCDFMAYALKRVGILLPSDFYEQDYPNWYLRAESAALAIAEAYLMCWY